MNHFVNLGCYRESNSLDFLMGKGSLSKSINYFQTAIQIHNFCTSFESLLNILSKYHMLYGAHGWASDSNLHPNSNHWGENSLKTGKNCGLVLPTTLRFSYFLLQFLSFER